MSIRTFVYILFAVISAIFVLANWAVISHPAALNLLVATVNLPIGLVMLFMVLAVLAIDLVALELHRFGWRRQRRELLAEREHLRAVAEQAEESRISALRALIERETAALRSQLEQVLARLPA